MISNYDIINIKNEVTKFLNPSSSSSFSLLSTKNHNKRNDWAPEVAAFHRWCQRVRRSSGREGGGRDAQRWVRASTVNNEGRGAKWTRQAAECVMVTPKSQASGPGGGHRFSGVRGLDREWGAESPFFVFYGLGVYLTFAGACLPAGDGGKFWWDQAASSTAGPKRGLQAYPRGVLVYLRGFPAQPKEIGSVRKGSASVLNGITSVP